MYISLIFLIGLHIYVYINIHIYIYIVDSLCIIIYFIKDSLMYAQQYIKLWSFTNIPSRFNKCQYSAIGAPYSCIINAFYDRIFL